MRATFAVGEQSLLLRKSDAVWLDPDPNGNFIGAYSEYNPYQFVVVWRERNTVDTITAILTDYYYDQQLKLLANAIDARILASFGS